MLRKHIRFSGQTFRAQKKVLNTFLLIQEKSGGKEEIWAEKVLVPFGSLRNGESEGKEPAFVACVQCISLLEHMNEDVKCMCLQWETSVSPEVEHDIGKKENNGCCGSREVAPSYFMPKYCVYCARSRAGIAEHYFTTELLQCTHIFYTSRFFRDRAVKRSRVHK